MSRGFDGNPKGDINAARRKKDRRAAAAQAQRMQRKRIRILERKHAGAFLRPAQKVARDIAGSHGWDVRVERFIDADGRRALIRWNEAVIQLVPADISVRFALGDKSGGSPSTIRLYAGERLLRTCAEELLRSGDGQAFATWLSEGLTAAAERRSADKM